MMCGGREQYMKKTCNGCIALRSKRGEKTICMLKFKINQFKPLEDCPKPNNMLDLSNRLEKGRGNYAERYRTIIAHNKIRSI